MIIKLRLSDAVNCYDFIIESTYDGVDIREDGEGRCLARDAAVVTLEAEHCCYDDDGFACHGVRERLTLTVSQ